MRFPFHMSKLVGNVEKQFFTRKQNSICKISHVEKPIFCLINMIINAWKSFCVFINVAKVNGKLYILRKQF